MNESSGKTGRTAPHDHTARDNRRAFRILIFLVLSIIFLLMCIEYIILTGSDRDKAYQTADMMISQIENIMENNDTRTDNLIASLKESYITKAKAVAYILDHVSDADTDIEELKKIADLMSIDEIHIFNKKGMIYAGTVPEYYHYSFDSGEQMAYFKPMLKNRDLAMCQDVTPNTAEGKSMMYAICWNEPGDKMIQIGIEPVRLLNELHSNEMSEILRDVPVIDGMTILIADAETTEILASTKENQVGKTLLNIGVLPDRLDPSGYSEFAASVDLAPSYCVSRVIDQNIVMISQEKRVVNSAIPVILGTLLLYLLLAAAAIAFITRRMVRRLNIEHQNSLIDPLTGLLNRKAYDHELEHLDEDPQRGSLIYLSMDLNGLKEANDTQGHDAGDTLLSGAAEVMKSSFGLYGRIYRVGGDEFVGLVHLNDAQFRKAEELYHRSIADWTERNGVELSISYGCARAEEHPDYSLEELAKLADSKMYEEKTRYYQSKGHDRRSHNR